MNGALTLVLTCLALLGGWSGLVALLRHPGTGRSLLLSLARLSVLRFANSPGTLHILGTAQPPPPPDGPDHPARMAMGIAAERAFLAAGGLLGVQDVLPARLAWAEGMRAAWEEWQRQLAMKEFGIEPTPRMPKVIVAQPLRDTADDTPPERPRGKSLPPERPRGKGGLTPIVLLVALGLSACPAGSARQSTALEVWGQAQDAQGAALVELTDLTREVESALVRPLPGRTREAARADLMRWWERQEDVLDTARFVRKATQGAAVELSLDSGPEAKEATARKAWEAARQLQREIEALRRFASDLLLPPPDLPRAATPSDGGVG